MSRRNLISSFVLGLACGLIALPLPARADRDAPASSSGRRETVPTPQATSAKSAARPAPTPGQGASGAAPTSPSARTGATAANAAERARLAAELERINAEIDALKRSPRGIRDDYRLRSRMADAEAVSRRLTELEARVGSVGTPAAAGPPATWPREVPAGPADDRTDLEAKADILADEARRLTAEANRLETRVVDLRARRELRRRAGQLERDPFSPLEQPKPRVLAVGSGTSPQAATGSKNGSGQPRSGTNLGAEGSGPAAGTTPPTAPTASPAGGTAMGADSAGGGTTSATNNAPSATAAPQPYGVLDPTLLAQVRRLDAPGAPPANLDTLETAVAKLRARSADLTRSAAALRARAAQRAY